MQKNKKGMAISMIFTLIAIVLAVVVAIIFFSNPTFRLMVLAIAGIVFSAMIIYNQTLGEKTFRDNYFLNMFMVFILLVSIMGLIFLSIPQASFNTMSVSNVQIDGQDKLLVTGTLNGVEALSFYKSSADIENDLGGGYEVDGSMSFSARIIGTQSDFPYQVNSGESNTLYDVYSKFSEDFTFWAGESDCAKNDPTNTDELIAVYSKVGFWQDSLYCVYKKADATVGTWNSYENNKISTEVIYNGETKLLESGDNGNYLSFSDGTIIKNIGQIGTEYSLNQPDYSMVIPIEGTPFMSDKLVKSNNYDAYQDVTRCFNDGGLTKLFNKLTESEVTACINQFDINNDIPNRNSAYKNGLINAQSVDTTVGGKITVTFDQPTFSGQVITIESTADAVGIRKITAKPDLVSVQDVSIEGSETKKTLVTFTTNIDANFYTYLECSSGANGIGSQNVFGQAGKLNTYEIDVGASNTGTQSVTENCEVVIESAGDRNLNDRLSFDVTVDPINPDECSTVGEKICSVKEIWECNAQYDWDVQEKCDTKCVTIGDGDAICEEDQMCVTDRDCDADEVCTSGTCIDKPVPPNTCNFLEEYREIYDSKLLGFVKVPTGEYECKLKDTTYLGAGVLVILIFGVAVIISNPNRKKDKKLKTNMLDSRVRKRK